MTYGPLTDVLRYIRRIRITAATADLDDGRLLERFIEQRDEAAFEALLHRHGPMVLGVCRRLLRDGHDIEDAFQATFLVLVRRARSLRKRERVANWLYGVGYRTALRARTEAALHSAHTKPLLEVPGNAFEHDMEWKELRAVLDEEVQRLPAKYWMPVVLSYLEGKTFQEAARQLGWPAGTVSGRLARAKELLRARLTRRGFELAGGLLDAGLSQTASGSVPVPLRIATLQAALSLTAKDIGAACLIPTSVQSLMEGVLHAMFLTKLKVAAVVVLVLAVAGGGTGVVTYQKLVAQPPSQKEATAPKILDPAEHTPEAIQKEAERLQNVATAVVTPEDKLKANLNKFGIQEKLKSLLWARFDAASTEVKVLWKEFCAYGRRESARTFGRHLNISSYLQPIYSSSRRLLAAQVGIAFNKADRLAAYETHLQRMQQAQLIFLEWARLNEVHRVNAGGAFTEHPIIDIKQAEYYRLEAEIALEEAKTSPMNIPLF
jgi:RNA polymerase sigma factor (sigma-70 family)